MPGVHPLPQLVSKPHSLSVRRPTSSSSSYAPGLRLKKHRNHLKGNYARFNRWEDASFRSWFSAIQPLPAWLGLISCLAIVVVLNSASMWNGKQVVLKSVTAYLGVSSRLLLPLEET